MVHEHIYKAGAVKKIISMFFLSGNQVWTTELSSEQSNNGRVNKSTVEIK